MNRGITGAVLDPDQEYCAQLQFVLDQVPGIHRLTVHFNLADALAEFAQQPPDVLLVEISLGDQSPGALVKTLKAAVPKAALIVLTQQQGQPAILASLQAGACGYLLKDTPLAHICDCVQEAHAGGSPLSPRVARQLADWFRANGTASSHGAALTKREQQILSRAAEGAQNREIAQALHLSEATIRAHLRRTYEKLHVHSRAQAVACLR